MANIIGLSIRKAANTAFFKSMGELIKTQPWKDASVVLNDKDTTKYFNWLGELSGVKRFVDERDIKSLEQHDHSVNALKWEDTVGISVDDLNEFGSMIKERIKQLAYKFAQHPNKLFFDFLKAGDGEQSTGGAKATYPWAGCFDTQTFFSDAHPVYLPDVGASTTNDNIATGTGVDTVGHIKADFDTALQGFYNLTTRDGTPMFDYIPDNYTIYCGSEDVALFNAVFNQQYDSAANTYNSYYKRAKVIASAHLNTTTPYNINDHASTYTQGSWFIVMNGAPVKPFIFYEVLGLKMAWDTKDEFMRDLVYYGGKGKYNMCYAYWQAIQKVYNA